VGAVWRSPRPGLISRSVESLVKPHKRTPGYVLALQKETASRAVTGVFRQFRVRLGSSISRADCAIFRIGVCHSSSRPSLPGSCHVATRPKKTLQFQIRCAGKGSLFRVHVFMDDINAPDIYFFAPVILKQEIEAEFMRFAEEKGV